MTNPSTILAGLARRGVTVSAPAGRLETQGELSEMLRLVVDRHRGALTLALVERTSPVCAGCRGPHMATAGTLCFWCRTREAA